MGKRVVAVELLVISVCDVDEVTLDLDLTDLGTANGGGVALVRRQGLLQSQRHAVS